MLSQASYVTLREAILKPRLVGKKMLVRSGGVRIFSKSSFIMCNGSLGRHGNSLGIQIFLQSSQARSSVPSKISLMIIQIKVEFVGRCKAKFHIHVSNVLACVMSRECTS